MPLILHGSLPTTLTSILRTLESLRYPVEVNASPVPYKRQRTYRRGVQEVSEEVEQQLTFEVRGPGPYLELLRRRLGLHASTYADFVYVGAEGQAVDVLSFTLSALEIQEDPYLVPWLFLPLAAL
jgi:hypothetical protein